ncbi:hypothetical protein C4552_02700 [Candidatus Parcubacteria bacterium]|nr:MAG: hypothetical protein C4552_02700 [Candidatus Parcubacteria bacterium]
MSRPNVPNFKTVFITCARGIIARNILATDALAKLLERDVRVVILAPEGRADALRQEYGGERVFIEPVPAPPESGKDRILWVLATNLLPTKTRRVQRLAKFERDCNRFDYWLSGFTAFLGRFRPVRTLFRAASMRLATAGSYGALFDRWKPDLLFATDVYAPEDVSLMRFARRRGVRVLGMVRSWDNVTSKTLLQYIPEDLVVNAERVRDEIIRYGDMPAERIAIVGIPHYDHYTNTVERTPREEFLRRLGLDPTKKTILFTPPADRYLQGDPVAPIILDALADLPAQVLVRMPVVGKSDFAGKAPPANAVFDAPANSADFVDVHLDRAADRHLADSLAASDLVITWASTMIIDAAVFNKPIILVGFDASPRPYGRSIRQYYDYEHQRHIIDTGGVRLVQKPEELRAWVRRYLTDPREDEAARQVIIREHCYRLDGRAGERLAERIATALDPR